MSILWTAELETGISKIDSQHKEIIEKINKMDEIHEQNSGKEVVEEYIDFLIKYISQHFQSEEQYMRDNNYLDLDMHKTIHDEFIKKVYAMAAEFRGSGSSTDLFDYIKKFLGEWFVNHILKIDLDMIKKVNASK